MKDLDDLLGEHPLFAGLGADMRALLAGCARNVHFPADGCLFRTGEPADSCYLLRSGRVALELVGAGGRRVVVDTVDAGGVVGLSWLVPPYRWYLDARAVEPTSAIALDAACLRAKCDDDPRTGYLLLQRVAHAMYERMQSSRVRMLDVYGAAPHGG
jgi:CRP-like cAMP-binding protein